MKKILLTLLILTTITLLATKISYAVSSVNVTATATVPTSTPELSVVILEMSDDNADNNPWLNAAGAANPVVTTMNYGTLTHYLPDGADADTLPDEAGIWFGTKSFCVVIYTQPYGKPYNVTSTCTAGLTSAGIPLPASSFSLTPVYSIADKYNPTDPAGQGAMPIGAVLGTAGSAVATGKSIYSSELGTAKAVILQAYYGLPPKKATGDWYAGWAGIPLSQTAGTYTGTATISIAVK